MSYCNVPFPAPATQSHAPTLPGTSIDCACHQMSHWTQRHTATYPSGHQPPRATLQRYQDASITCHQMSHWCCACHATSRCNAHATYSLHQPPRPTLQRYQDASIDCACHQMSHWCCATASHCNAPFPAPATQSHAPTLYQDASITCHQMSHWCCACHTTSHCNVHATYHSLHQPPRATLQRYQDASIDCACHQIVLRLPRNVILQRTIPCTSHPEPRSNATRMLQSTAPATKCHTGAAPATQRHNSTYHSLHQPHRSTLQLEVSRVQASQFHVYKRANFTCTSEPAPLWRHPWHPWVA